MLARRLTSLALAAAICAGAAACGGGSGSGPESRAAGAPTSSSPSRPAPRDATDATLRADTRVIRGWSDALRAGRVDQAASYFALPSVIDDGSGSGPLLARTRIQVRLLTTFSCGSILRQTRRVGRYVVARFVLTDRPGGSCGAGTGQTAYTAFVIRDGKIREWRRVPGPSALPPSGRRQAPPAPHIPGSTNTAPTV